MSIILRFAVLVLCLSACTPKATVPGTGDRALNELQRTMSGSFSSELQASVDDAYYDIDLHMQPIWQDRGHYLYVEQAVAATPEAPYRQRVYQLERRGKKLISKVYELPNPERYVGAHTDPDKLSGLHPDDLIERQGCAVILKQDREGLYRGSTRKEDCKSSLRGAAYATSRVSISDSFIQSWDRGFDAEGQQVWGATDGGYMFLKE